jgi:hypothetical protein
MPNPNCTRCGNKLSKERLAAKKRKCYLCEVAVRREQKRRGHDKNIESEDFTAEDYWRLYEAQGSRCAIYTCRATGKSKHLTVDHDHTCEMGHDPARWCRVCVRGLICSMHNVWIGRTGDNPEIFDALAGYLRVPPARETLMGRMIVGTDEQTMVTLHRDYNITYPRAKKMIDLARGVGPSPTAVKDGTIVIRYIRIPRSTQVLYEIIETAPRITREPALRQLIDEYGLSERRAKSLLNAVWKNGKARASTPNGIARVDYHGRVGGDYLFSIENDNVPEVS